MFKSLKTGFGYFKRSFTSDMSVTVYLSEADGPFFIGVWDWTRLSALSIFIVYPVLHMISPSYFVFFDRETIYRYAPTLERDFQTLTSLGKPAFAHNFVNFTFNCYVVFIIYVCVSIFTFFIAILVDGSPDTNRELQSVPREKRRRKLKMMLLPGIFLFSLVYYFDYVGNPKFPKNELLYFFYSLSILFLYGGISICMISFYKGLIFAFFPRLWARRAQAFEERNAKIEGVSHEQ